MFVYMEEKENLEVVISTRLERSTRDELAELAQQADRTFAQEMRRAIRWYCLAEPAARSKGTA